MAARRRHRGRPAGTVGLIATLVIAALVYLGFTKDIPFVGKPFEVEAVFESANSIRANSPVRISGVNVGKVSRVEAQEGGNGAVVVLNIKDEGLPIHSDATAKIRPRIFLEGNFFVDLNPGSPSAPVLDSGDAIKVTQTATPVQLDQVLTALQEDTREDLRDTLDGLSRALNEKPTAAQDRRADPSTRGETAAESFNDTYDDSAAALRSTSVFNEALLGTEPDEDIARLIDGGAKTTEALARDEQALQDLVTNFNRTVAAFAAESSNLQRSIRLLGPTLETANEAFAALNAAFPPTRAFAREILPGVRETPETIRVSFPWIEETRRLLAPAELQGLARDLSPATRDLAILTDHLQELLPEADLVARCATNTILPTGDVVIEDEFNKGFANYKEFWHAMVGLSGESQNFDGNGPYVRFQPGGGSQTVSLGEAGGSSELFSQVAATPLGTRPRYPGKRPPYVTSEPCHEQGVPNLNGPAGQKGPPDRVVGTTSATSASTSASGDGGSRTASSGSSDEASRTAGSGPGAAADPTPEPTPVSSAGEGLQAVRDVVSNLRSTLGVLGGGR